MNNKLIWLLILFVFILEGTWVHWLIPSGWYQDIQIAPHFVLVIILYVTMNNNRHLGLFFALLFGLMHDIVYASPMLGPHSFSMGLAAYMIGVITKRIKVTLISTLMIISLIMLFYDTLNFALYRMFRVIDLPFMQTFTDYMIPTLLFNLLFTVMIYVPARRWLDSSQILREEEPQ